jgi:hypothetical protein
MRHWKLSPSDIVINGSTGKFEDAGMGLSLEVIDGDPLMLKFSNSRRRFVFCRIHPLPTNESFDPSADPPIGPTHYWWYPPLSDQDSIAAGLSPIKVTPDTLLYTTHQNFTNLGPVSDQEYTYSSPDPKVTQDYLLANLGLIFPKHDVPFWIVGSAAFQAKALLPPFARFEFCSWAPCLDPVMQKWITADPVWSLGVKIATLATMENYWLTRQISTEDKLTSIGIAICEAAVLAKYSEDFARIAGDILDGSILDPHIVQAEIIAASVLLNSPEVKDYLVEKAGESVEELFFEHLHLPQVTVWSEIVGLCNTLKASIDLLGSTATTRFMVDIEALRSPMLREPVQQIIKAGVGYRSHCPIEISLPDGRLMAFADGQRADQSLEIVPEEAFSAQVRCLNDNEQGYEFTNIIAINGGEAELLPIKFTISASTDYVLPPFSVRPVDVPEDLSLDNPGPVDCYFPNGLGAFIKGLAEGSGTVKIVVESGQIPEAGYASAENALDVEVSGGALELNWDTIPETKTGSMIDLPLKITYPIGIFDLLSPFSAAVTFEPDCSSIELNEIISEALQNTLLYSMVRIKLPDINGQGQPYLVFKPDASLIAEAAVGRIRFAHGLRELVQVQRAGNATLVASLLDQTSPDEAETPIESNADITIVTTQTSINVAPDSLVFDDDLEGGFGVTVNLPDEQTFLTSQQLQAEINLTSSQHMEITDINYNPDSADPHVSPLNLVYNIDSGSSVELFGDNLIGGVLQNWPLFNEISDFIRAIDNGSAMIRVSGLVRNDIPFDLLPPPDVFVQVQVAGPAKVVIEGYQEIYTDNNIPHSEVISISNNGNIDLWRTAHIQLTGHIENYTGKTEASLSVDGTSGNLQLTPDPNGPCAFTADVIFALQPGTHLIHIEATKKTNFGKPGVGELTVNCLGAVLNFDDSQIKTPTGDKNINVQFTGKYADAVTYKLTRTDGTVTTPSYISNPLPDCQTDGNFNWQVTDSIIVGVNTLEITATNVFQGIDKTWKIEGKLPDLSLLTKDQISDANYRHLGDGNTCNVYQQSIPIQVVISYANQAALTVSPPNGNPVSVKIPATLSADSSETISVSYDIDNDGDYIFQLTASNSLGNASCKVTITLVERTYIWSIYELKINPVDQSAYSIEYDEYNPGTKKTNHFGPAASFDITNKFAIVTESQKNDHSHFFSWIWYVYKNDTDAPNDTEVHLGIDGLLSVGRGLKNNGEFICPEHTYYIDFLVDNNLYRDVDVTGSNGDPNNIDYTKGVLKS